MNVYDKKTRTTWGFLFSLPTILGLIILNIIPAIQTIYFSFHRTGAFGKGNEFVGFDNYERLINDSQVWQATWNTIRYTLLTVPFSIIIALVLAVILNSKIKGRTVYRTIFFLPMVAAPAAVTMVWRWIFDKQFGILNYILEQFGINPISWIEDPKVAMISLAIIGIWSTIGYNMILFLAGLQEIPNDFYESASIDGASSLQQFFKITIPLLSPQIFFVSITGIITGLQVFDTIYMLISVRFPSYPATVSLVYLFYNNTFKYSDKGYGSAIVVLLLLIILLVTFVQVRGQKKWVHYMGE